MQNLKHDENYALVGENAWKMIRAIYGGGPEIKIEDKDECSTVKIK